MSKLIKVLVVGTKNFDDYIFFEEKLYEILNKYFEENYDIILREQESTLTDGFVVRFCKENNCILERYEIQWNLLGKRAGFENIKNIIWGNNAESSVDLLICFCNKEDNMKDKFMMNKIIDEFQSIINFDNNNIKLFNLIK